MLPTSEYESVKAEDLTCILPWLGFIVPHTNIHAARRPIKASIAILIMFLSQIIRVIEPLNFELNLRPLNLNINTLLFALIRKASARHTMDYKSHPSEIVGSGVGVIQTYLVIPMLIRVVEGKQCRDQGAPGGDPTTLLQAILFHLIQVPP